MNKFYFIIFLIFISCSKKPTEEKPNVLTLKEMSDLATVEYTVTKIIKANDNKTWFKMGDRKILMSCEAIIKAGVDMSSINENSFTINGRNIHLQLPPPQVISFNIPPDKIKIEYQQVGVFRDPFGANERNLLASQAEVQIKNSINSLGILDQAKANTSLFVSNFLKQLGYENITITYTPGRPINTIE
jgi:hypothetical protein